VEGVAVEIMNPMTNDNDKTTTKISNIREWRFTSETLDSPMIFFYQRARC